MTDANRDSYFLGQVVMFGGPFTRSQFVQCDGAVLLANQNLGLLALLSTVYGGDGMQTLQVPDLRGRSPMGAGPTFALGQQAGAERVTLAAAHMPPHTHDLFGSAKNGAFNLSAAESGKLLLGAIHAENADEAHAHPAAYAPYNREKAVRLTHATVVSSGNAQTHENMQPFAVVRFSLCVNGAFPQR